MDSSIDKIKENLNIVDVVGSYIKIEKSGQNYRAKCPFHNEKTPSFFLSPQRSSFYCFGCNVGGDIFSFVEKFEGVDFRGALKILADRAGVTLVSSQSGPKEDKQRFYEMLELATEFYQVELEKNDAAKDYLRDRGLKLETIHSFKIGYAPIGWSNIHNFLKSKGYTDQEIEKNGLIKIVENKKYDRFRGRIMFPIFDSTGRVIAFSGRILDPNSEEGKYINSPETILYNKKNVLFGIDRAKSAIRERDYCIVVEGQMDLIMSHQAGIKNTVAASGTAFSDDADTNTSNIALIKRLTNNIMFAFDRDEAGSRATARATKLAMNMGMEVKIVEIPNGKDPADAIKEDKEIWFEALKNSKNIIDFEIMKIKEKAGSNKKLLAEMVNKDLLPTIAEFTNSIRKGQYVSDISAILGINESFIREDLKKIEIEKRNPKEKVKVENKTIKNIEEIMYGLSLIEINQNKEDLKKWIEENIKSDYWQNIVAKQEKEKEKIVFFVENSLDNNKEKDKLIENYKNRFRYKYIEDELAECTSRLKELERNKNNENEEKLKEILIKCSMYSKELNLLKKII